MNKRIFALALAIALSFNLSTFSNAFTSDFAIEVIEDSEEVEPNNAPPIGQTINSQQRIEGILAPNDQDWYAVTISTESRVLFAVIPDTDQLEDCFYVYLNENGGHIAASRTNIYELDSSGEEVITGYSYEWVGTTNTSFQIGITYKSDDINQKYEDKGGIPYKIYYESVNGMTEIDFQKVKTYSDELFNDISSDAWYFSAIKTAYELGLMNGDGNSFNPNGNMTYAEAITIASRISKTFYTGNSDFAQQNPWYQAYVDYANDNGILKYLKNSNSTFKDAIEKERYKEKSTDTIFTTPITREDFALLLVRAIPERKYEKINAITAIPDISRDSSNLDQILTLYNAGVVTGNDEYGTFKPNSNIRRSEVATIISRVVQPNTRVHFTLKEKPLDVVRVIISTSSSTLGVGETINLSAQVSPEKAADKNIAWSSSNSAVATVSQNGEVSALKQGVATIYAKSSNGKSAECQIKVIPQREADIIKGKYAYALLKGNLKFPDSLEVHNAWAYREGAYITIELDYSSASNIGTVRNFFKVYFRNGEYSSAYTADSPSYKNAKDLRTLSVSLLK